jgi:hypothetical protein
MTLEMSLPTMPAWEFGIVLANLVSMEDWLRETVSPHVVQNSEVIDRNELAEQIGVF